VYAGLRPLLAGESESTSRLSREHVVAQPVPGLVLVAGGKYTTYRLMARDAVDAVVHALDWRAPPSCTDRVPLAGADGYLALWNARHRLAQPSGLHVARIEHLLRRYGSLTPEVLDLIAAEPALGRPVTGADDYLRAEIVYAASHEGARHLDDVLGRRTHIAVETPDRGMAALAEIAGLVAGPLRWDTRQEAGEVEHYRAGVAAERDSQEAGTDADADAIRGAVPDIVPVLSAGEAGGNGAAGMGAARGKRGGKGGDGRGGVADGVRDRSH
jgi:glycerol-3-phosphate dehydrogenase